MSNNHAFLHIFYFLRLCLQTKIQISTWFMFKINEENKIIWYKHTLSRHGEFTTLQFIEESTVYTSDM